MRNKEGRSERFNFHYSFLQARATYLRISFSIQTQGLALRLTALISHKTCFFDSVKAAFGVRQVQLPSNVKKLQLNLILGGCSLRVKIRGDLKAVSEAGPITCP